MVPNSKRDNKRKLWRQRISAYRNSNLTAKKWCEKNQVNYHTLKYWITKINKENQPNKKEIRQWVNIEPSCLAANKDTSSIHVQVGQYEVTVKKGFDENTFKEVMQILAQC